jgi:hypothetical protein
MNAQVLENISFSWYFAFLKETAASCMQIASKQT